MNNAITWFEIPCADFERAVSFYTNLLQIEIYRETFLGMQQGFFPFDTGGVGGTLVANPNIRPTTDGSLVYLRADNLDDILARIPSLGGQILLPITSIGANGRIAIILDSEGNRVGLHQPT